MNLLYMIINYYLEYLKHTLLTFLINRNIIFNINITLFIFMIIKLILAYKQKVVLLVLLWQQNENVHIIKLIKITT
jgi:hypothetical protein